MRAAIRALVPVALALLLATCAGSPSGAMRETASVPTIEPQEELRAEEPAPEAPAPAATAGKEQGDADLLSSRRLSTEASPRLRAPELLARVQGPDLEPLPSVAQDITVVVSAFRARVVLDLVFRNPSDQVLAGTLEIALPDRASPASLATYQGAGLATPVSDGQDLSALLDATAPTPDAALAPSPALDATWSAGNVNVDWGNARTAVVVNPVQGRQVYESVTRARVDPALAEWAGSGSYSARIYPIPAGGLKRVIFAYDQTLVPSNGKMLLNLPLPGAQAQVRRLTVHDLSATVADGSLTVDGATLTPARGAGGLRTWTVGPQPADAAIYTSVPRNPALLSLSGMDSAVPGTLVTALITPDLPRQTLLRPTGRALILLDTSASGRDLMSGLQAKILKALLEGDDSLTQFALVAFDVRATLLTPGFVDNTQEARTHYLGLVDQIWLEGSTAFDTALRYVEATPELGRADTLFLLSDGEITWGADSPALLAREHPDLMAKRWICYSIGDIPHNRRLFDTLTREAGQTVQVGLGQPLADVARAHRYPVYHLDHVRSVLQDEVVVAGDPVLIYPGQVLSVAVRVVRAANEVRLLVGVDGKDIEVRVPIARQNATDALAARTWAELYVAGLQDEPEQREVEAIEAISRHFRLSNDYASFLILESDEDIERYGVNLTPLDFRQVRQTLGTRARGSVPGTPVISGLAVPEELDEGARSALAGLVKLGDLAVWSTPLETRAEWAPKFILTRPAVLPESQSSTSLYVAAQSLMTLSTGGDDSATPKPDSELYAAQALRTLSTIAEHAPRDDRALRLVGFVLMQWGFYDEAESLFGRVRARRPFEPQNALLEALAQAAQGKIAAAALRYEIVLGQTFPRFEDYARPVAARLYADLLREVIRRNPAHADLPLWQARLEAAEAATGEQTRGPRPGETPAGRLLLFWNIDDTDVDLHVREGLLSEVWYGRMSSLGGGRLYWDNTEGLGPELYEHPRLSLGGFRVSVDYFGSSSVEGAAPAATFVAAFARKGRDPQYRAGWYATVLVGERDDQVEIMPIWRRP